MNARPSVFTCETFTAGTYQTGLATKILDLCLIIKKNPKLLGVLVVLYVKFEIVRIALPGL